MRLGRLVVADDYMGKERRSSSPDQRRRYREAHGMDTRSSRPSHWLGWLPKPILLGVALAAIGTTFVFGTSWVRDVNARIAKSDENHGRIANIEAAANVAYRKAQETSEDLTQVKVEVSRVKSEVAESREDQLSFYLWMAEKEGDTKAVQKFLARLRELREKKAGR